MCQPARAATVKLHRLGAGTTEFSILLFWRLEVRGEGVDRVNVFKAFLLGLRVAMPSCVFTWSPFCPCLCPDLLFLKETSQTGVGPALRLQFNFIIPLKAPSKV